LVFIIRRFAMSSLKQVFPRVHFRYDECRYAEDLEHFAAWLCGRGYRNKPARTHLYNVQQVLQVLAMPPSAKLHIAKLAAAFRRCGDGRLRYQHSLTTFTHFLRSRGQLIEPLPKIDRFESVRREFCERLGRRSGLRPSSIEGYNHWIGDFLGRSLGRTKPLDSLTTVMFESYVKARQPELAACTLRSAIQCIRAFLQFCFERGLLRERVDIIDRPVGLRDDQPPRALAWPMILRFLGSIDRGDWVGRRDHLILHLMAYYGLRPGEVGLLTLDDIDWLRGTMTINQQKTSSTLILPIDERTKSLLRSFIERDRPVSKLPWVIPKAQAPEGQMSKFALSFVLKTRARLSGLPITHCSSYALRHSFAMRLFDRGVGIKAIGDLMGHNSLSSTGVYLRLQTDVLRDVALPVSGGGHETGGAA
jgi:integrase/recombinase XerD